MIRSSRHLSQGQEISLRKLQAPAPTPIVQNVGRWLRRKKLQAELRSLVGLADYFAWQESNGRAVLADTHKRMVAVRSELNALNWKKAVGSSPLQQQAGSG